MTEPVDRSDKGFVEHWRRVGPILEAIRRSESLLEQGADDVETIVITLSKPVLRKLQERAKEMNVAPEELMRVSVEEWLQRPRNDFECAADYVLEKNVLLYRRLA
jgi:hypothetical protein